MKLVADNIPASLKSRKQWLCWRWEWSGKKWDKPPYSAITQKKCNSEDGLASFEECLALANDKTFDGIGFRFLEEDPYIGIDLDDCYKIETGELDLGVATIINRLDSYHEISPSSTGVKIIVEAESLPGKRSCTSWSRI